MPRCNISEAHVIDFVCGELSPSQTSRFKNHLTGCHKCTTRLHTFKHVLNLVDEAEGDFLPNAIAPPNLQMKLYKRLAEVPPEKPSLFSKINDIFSNIFIVMREQKIASLCIFCIAVVAVAFFVGNPFRPTATLEIDSFNSADARIEQYRQQDIQRSMEDVIRNSHLRGSDSWDTVSQLNRVKDQAKGTDWANIANKQLERVHSEF